MGTTLTKEIKAKDNGTYFLAGLEAREFEITCKADGFVPTKLVDRIPTGGILTKDITLLTKEQAYEESLKGNPDAKATMGGMNAGNAGAAAFNSASPLYSSQKFTEALPFLEKAYTSYQEALEKTKDEKDLASLQTAMLTVKRIYGVTLFEVGSAEESRKTELWAKSEPILLEVLPQIPETNPGALLPAVKALQTMAEAKKDQAAVSKYQAIVDKIEPPNPAKDYNKAVDAFNDGKLNEAKSYLDRTLEKDPKYAKAYYLMGMVEYANSNMKATKTCFLKYLELDPTGEKAADIKAMLEDPSLKKIK
jgi:tetratricopeptide (TPR) repeat protein